MRGNAHPWSIYLLMALSSAAEFISEWDDCAVSLDPLCTKIRPGVDLFLGVLPFHWHFICFALLKSCVVS